jgi:hypothetical protein
MREGVNLSVGEAVLVRSIEGNLVVQRSNAIIATLSDPPAEYRLFVESGCGAALGEISAVHNLSGVAEVKLCQ